MPSHSLDGDSIYSPETTDLGELALARRQFESEVMVPYVKKLQEDRQALENDRRKVEEEKRNVRRQTAENWRTQNLMRGHQARIEEDFAEIEAHKGVLVKRTQELELEEGLRRRNRTVSEAYIEDSFATLSPRAVVENLTHASDRIRKHAMKNVSTCIGGNKIPPPTIVQFAPDDIAPDLLPKLHQLVSSSAKPAESVLRFAEETVSAPPMARALATTGQCQRLSEYLVEANDLTSRLAVRCLRQMVRMELSVVQPAYEAMAMAIPQVPIPEPHEQVLHPSVDFVKEVAPRIIEDCFNNGLWPAVAPLVKHQITSIRQIALQKIVLLARNDRNQNGIVEADLLGLLDPQYQSFSPPPDVVTFFVELLPLVAERLFRRPASIRWLLNRLGDQHAKITATVIKVFHACVTNHDPVVFGMLVRSDVLNKLNDCPVLSPEIIKLITELISALAIPHVRAKAVDAIIRFLDHRDSNVVSACLSACKKIVDSTVEDRAHLFAGISKLSVTKKSVLDVYDFAMPACCRDWAASGNFSMIAQYVQHSEPQLRLPAQQVWRNIVRNSPSSRSKIVHDHLLDVIFELCGSHYPDAVSLGADCCTPMAIEITKAGIPPTEQLVGLLGVKAEHLREAALRGIQIASENNDANCQVLLKAGIFTALQSYFEDYPQDRLENASKILIRLVPFLRSSREACGGLLQLLGSKSSNVRDAARNALLAISNTSIGTREILRAVILDRLEFPSNSLIEYAVKAIQDWLGPDLAHLNDFPNFFGLIEHANERIQNSALIALTQKLSNADYHESLEKANIMSLLRSLSDSNNSKAVDFVKVALPALSLSLARNGHASDIIDLIAHNQLKVREGAATALETICRGPVLERKHLVEKNIIENLVARGDHLDKTEIHLLASIIPILVCDYLEAGKIDLIFPLVDHPQEQIRTATSKSIAVLAHGAIDLRTSLGKALLSQLEQGTPLLRQVAADCLSQSLAHDLVLGGDFAQVFSMFSSEDPNVRKPIIAQLRTYIQMSDETARGRLVEANILPAILQAYTPEKDDLLDFMTSYLLPMLGPSFTQNDGGVTLFPLLEHEESRLRTSAVQALKNAIDSRDANMEKMAKASIVLTLHPLTASNDIIRDLWCRILPKAAPYLENRAEIDVLFDSLNHDRGNVREAASEAITVLVKTSDASRSCMLPTLLYNLERQSPASVPSIARAISLSGFTFVSNGKEAELLFLIRDGKDVGIAAVEAIIQLLSKGGSYEHERLVRANPDILTSALKLHDDQSQRQRSLKLLRSIVMHLSYILFLDEESARALFSLFDDPDPGLSTALYQTWSNDSRVYESSIFSELIPLLFDGNRLRNPSVTALLRELADSVVPQLVKRRRLDTLVRALRVHDANVVRAYLEVTRYAIEDCHDNVKGWFVAEPLFIPAIGKYLKGRDAAMRRDCSSIIHSLSTGSASRSGRIMNEGIGNFLSWVAVKGEKGAQESSLEALCALFQAAPDHAERLVKESLPALCYVLGKEDLALVVHHKAFHLLLKIVQQSPHSPVVNSGIVAIVVRWLSPSYTVTDGQCKKVALDICRLIAENSDTGRNSLINAGILPELLLLTSSQTAYEVMGACMILKALVHTGTFSQHVIAAGLKTSMEHITSPIRKSTLKIKEDKQFVQAVAKDVLNLLKQSKQRDVKSLLQAQVPEGLLSQAHPLAVSLPHQEGPPNDEGFIPVDSERSRRTWRRSKSDSEPLGSIDSATLDPEMEEVRESVTGNARHSRSRGNPARPPPRSRRADLSTLPENPNMSDFSQDTPFEEDEDLEEREPSSPSSSQRTVHSIPSPISPPPLRRAATTTSRLQRSPNDGFLMDPSSIAPTHFRTTSLPYGPSAPGPRRRRNQDDDTPESLTLGSELDSNTAERGAASSQGSARRRSSYLPSFGSIRR